MLLTEFVQFLHLAIVHLGIESVTLMADPKALPTLIDQVQQRLPIIPTVVVSIPSETKERPTGNLCPHCPKRQITIVHLDENSNLRWLMLTLAPNYTELNRIVLLSARNDADSHEYVAKFPFYNILLAKIDRGGRLEVTTWIQWIYSSQNHPLPTFRGPAELFRSNETSALMFRKQMQRWPERPAVEGKYMAVMMAPFNFLLRERGADGGERLLLASSIMTLIQFIGDVLRLTMNVYFRQSSACPECFDALPLGNYRGYFRLFDHDEKVKYKNERYTSLVLAVAQTSFPANDNRMFGVRRYVAIVPYRPRPTDFGAREIVGSLMNAAVLLFWLGGAAFFAALRMGIQFRLDRKNHRTMATIFFGSFARTLGNSAGADRGVGRSESFVMFVIGVFATLTSMVFTGGLFEQFIGQEAPRQINSMEELIASRMGIIDCWGDHHIDGRGFPHPDELKPKQILSVGRIEQLLLLHNTTFVFVLPEVIADLVHHPALRYANGTPVYHIVAEPFRISPQFHTVVPLMMMDRFVAMWSRLVESGIDVHVERQTIEMYKSVRFGLRPSSGTIRGGASSNDNNNNNDLSNGLELKLFAIVLGFGYASAVTVFVLEVIVVRAPDWVLRA